MKEASQRPAKHLRTRCNNNSHSQAYVEENGDGNHGEPNDYHLGFDRRTKGPFPEVELQGDEAIQQEGSEVPQREETRGLAEEDDEVAPGTELVDVDPVLSEPQAQQVEEIARVGDVQRHQVVHVGKLGQIRASADQDGEEVPDEPNTNDGRRVIHLHEGEHVLQLYGDGRGRPAPERAAVSRGRRRRGPRVRRQQQDALRTRIVLQHRLIRIRKHQSLEFIVSTVARLGTCIQEQGRGLHDESCANPIALQCKHNAGSISLSVFVTKLSSYLRTIHLQTQES